MILTTNDLRFRKIVIHNKIANITQTTKNQENYSQYFEDNDLTNHLVKHLQEKP